MGGRDNITVVLAKSNALPPVNGHRKKPATANALPAQTTPAPTEQKITAVAKEKHNSAPLWVLFLLLAGAAGFFFTRPTGIANTMAAAHTQPAIANDSVGLLRKADSSKAALLTGTPGMVQTEPAVVPVRLAHSLTLSAMLHDHPDTARILFELQQPARHSDSTALLITKNDSALLSHDTLTLRNKTFKDFKVGIRLQRPVFLKLENVVFENVKYPFYYDFKKDSAHLSTLKL
jgi:hypothetical protein